jgi:hypothetical protein
MQEKRKKEKKKIVINNKFLNAKAPTHIFNIYIPTQPRASDVGVDPLPARICASFFGLAAAVCAARAEP